MISEVRNCDCMEYMATLPDNAFDLVIADPPYGGANDTAIEGGGRFGGRFARYTQPKGYLPDTMRPDRRRMGSQIRGGLSNGTMHPTRNSSQNYSASAEIRLSGERTTSQICHLQDALWCGENAP